MAPFEAFDSVEGIFSDLGAPEVIEEGRSGLGHSIIRPSSAELRAGRETAVVGGLREPTRKRDQVEEVRRCFG